MFFFQVNDNYESTYVFENDFPALLKETPGKPRTFFNHFLCTNKPIKDL